MTPHGAEARGLLAWIGKTAYKHDLAETLPTFEIRLASLNKGTHSFLYILALHER